MIQLNLLYSKDNGFMSKTVNIIIMIAVMIIVYGDESEDSWL